MTCSRCLDAPALYIVRHADGSGPDMRVCYKCVREAIKPKYPHLRIERIKESEKENTETFK